MIDYAIWSPTQAKIAYVLNHDVYIHDMHTSTMERVTYDGGKEVFNGVADWVFEGSPRSNATDKQRKYLLRQDVFGGPLIRNTWRTFT